MAFKADASFLRYLSIGAVGVQRIMKELRDEGFEPIELERYCASNKIWTTKVKRLRLPDLLCIKTGMRVEARAKTDLKIRMSDAPSNPDRVWDSGLRDNDIVAVIACSYTDYEPHPANHANYFTVRALRESVGQSKLGPPKSASEGAERDRTWPATVPSRNGTVLEVSPNRVVVQMHADPERQSRKQTYALKGKTAYVEPGEEFEANSIFLAGAPSAVADLSTYSSLRYEPLNELGSGSSVDRYAAVKALRYRQASDVIVVSAVEGLIRKEPDPRVALEAAGSGVALGSEFAQTKLAAHIWDNDDLPELRMEAVFILTELGNNFARDQLRRVASDPKFLGDELRQAAVWGLGKAGIKSYEDLLSFVDDADEGVAMHAICAFDFDAPDHVLQNLAGYLLSRDQRRAAAASMTLRSIASERVVQAILAAGANFKPVPDWIIATLGLMPEAIVRKYVTNPDLLERIVPVQLTSDSVNWLSSEMATADFSFLSKQNVW